MFTDIVSRINKRQISELLSLGKRLDGRGLTDHREVQVEFGVIDKAEGSARVLLGKTEVIVGIKIETGTPFPDVPNAGVLTVNAEFLPLASPEFETGPPREEAIELARVVDRGLRESKAIDLEKLCIEPGKNVFIIFVDVYIINHDGNLIDASALASLAALLNTKIFNYEIKEGKIEIKTGYTPLQVTNYPIAVTLAKINNTLIADPWLEEERVMDARLTITLEKDEQICATQKSGSAPITREQISEALKIAREKAKELREHLIKKEKKKKPGKKKK
jgi:exosome complex component RRP42